MSQHDRRWIAFFLMLVGAMLATAGTTVAQRARATRDVEVLVVHVDSWVRGQVLWQGPGNPAIRSQPFSGKQASIPLDNAGTYQLFVDAVGFVPVSAAFVHDGTPGLYSVCLSLAPGTDLALTMSFPGGVLADDVQVAFAPEELTGLSQDELSHYLGVLQRTTDPPIDLSTRWERTLPAGSAGGCLLTNLPGGLAQIPLRITSSHDRYLPSLVLVSPPSATIELTAAWEYDVSATDTAGQPLTDLDVALIDRLNESRLSVGTSFTNARVEPGRYLLVVGCTGHLFATQELEVTANPGPGATSIPLVLEPAALVFGWVEHDGEAVHPALLHAIDESMPVEPAMHVGVTEPSGYFAMSLPFGSGPYRLEVVAASYEPYTISGVLPGDFVPASLTLAEAKEVQHSQVVLQVNWVSDEGMSPAPEETRIYAIGPADGIWAVGRGGERDGNTGRIDLTLEPRPYTLIAFDGSSYGSTVADLSGGGTAAAVVLSEPAAPVTVAVWRDGQPLPNVPVEITDPSLGGVLASGTTGQDGLFTTMLFPGAFIARAESDLGYVHAQPLQVQTQGGFAQLDLPSLGSLAAISVQLVDSGNSPIALTKTVQLVDATGGSFSLRLLTDAFGTASVVGVPPGSYLATTFDLEVGGISSTRLLAAFAASESQSVLLSPGVTTDLRLLCSTVQDGVKYGDKYQKAIDAATYHPTSTGQDPSWCDCWVYFYHLRSWMTKNASASDAKWSSAAAWGWWDTLFLDTWAFGTFDGGSTASASLEGWCYDMYVYEQRCWKCGTTPPTDEEYYRVADVELKVRGVVAQIDSSAMAAAQTAISAATDAEPEFKTVRATGGQAVGGWTSQQASIGVQVGISADGPEAGAGLSLNVELNPLPTIEYKEIDKLIAQGIPGAEGSRMKGHALTLVKETSGEAQSIASQLGLIGRVDKAFAAIATSMKYAIRTVCECRVNGCPMEVWQTIDRKSFGADHIRKVEGRIATVKALDFKR